MILWRAEKKKEWDKLKNKKYWRIKEREGIRKKIAPKIKAWKESKKKKSETILGDCP